MVFLFHSLHFALEHFCFIHLLLVYFNFHFVGFCGGFYLFFVCFFKNRKVVRIGWEGKGEDVGRGKRWVSIIRIYCLKKNLITIRT